MTKYFAVSIKLLYTDKAANANSFAENRVKKYNPLRSYTSESLKMSVSFYDAVLKRHLSFCMQHTTSNIQKFVLHKCFDIRTGNLVCLIVSVGTLEVITRSRT